MPIFPVETSWMAMLITEPPRPAEGVESMIRFVCGHSGITVVADYDLTLASEREQALARSLNSGDILQAKGILIITTHLDNGEDPARVTVRMDMQEIRDSQSMERQGVDSLLLSSGELVWGEEMTQSGKRRLAEMNCGENSGFALQKPEPAKRQRSSDHGPCPPCPVDRLVKVPLSMSRSTTDMPGNSRLSGAMSKLQLAVTEMGNKTIAKEGCESEDEVINGAQGEAQNSENPGEPTVSPQDLNTTALTKEDIETTHGAKKAADEHVGEAEEGEDDKDDDDDDDDDEHTEVHGQANAIIEHESDQDTETEDETYQEVEEETEHEASSDEGEDEDDDLGESQDKIQLVVPARVRPPSHRLRMSGRARTFNGLYETCSYKRPL